MKRKITAAALIALLILIAACWAFIADDYPADEAALAAMASASGVRVEQAGDAVAFIPDSADTGFIFYPGGKVEYTAYAPLMRALAEEGVLCVIPEMPFNLAFFGMNAAADVPQQYPQVEKWYIGGHSLGGSMAASYAAKHAEDCEGLALLAAYSTDDLTASGLEVISVIGSEDGVLNMENYEANRKNLPEGFQEHVIEGGCHAGFGSYGPQDGDGAPAISGEEQIGQTALLLIEFFQ